MLTAPCRAQRSTVRGACLPTLSTRLSMSMSLVPRPAPLAPRTPLTSRGPSPGARSLARAQLNTHRRLLAANPNSTHIQQVENQVIAQQSPPSSASGRDLILSILSAKPSKREAKVFLDQFQTPSACPQEPLKGLRLGIVKLDAGMSNSDLEAFARTLVAMVKLGLNPVIMLDFDNLPTPTTNALQKESLHKIVSVLPHRRKRASRSSSSVVPVPSSLEKPSTQHAHLTATSRSSLQSRAFMAQECDRLVEVIEKVGARGISLVHSRILKDSVKDGRLECVVDSLVYQMKRGMIPVLGSVVEESEGGSLRVGKGRDAVLAVAEGFAKLANAAAAESEVLPAKLFLLNQGNGGVFNPESGTHIALLNLTEDLGPLMQSIARQQAGLTDQCQRTLSDLRLAKEVLASLGKLSPSSSAVLASIKDTSTGTASPLISNWITDRPMSGSKTSNSMSKSRIIPPTVLRTGLPIQTFKSLEGVDIPRLSALLESSFAKPLHKDAFFTRLSSCIDTIIIAGDYQGAVLVTREGPHSIAYLDKFAVHPKSQGLGIADILWKRLVETYPNLCWRSRSANPVNKWYFERSEGNVKFGDDGYWMMFWFGREYGIGKLKECRAVCEAIEASFGSK